MMPKIRLGRFAAGPVEWRVGEQVRITVEDVAGTHDRVSTTYKGLAEDAHAGDRLLVDDGRVGLWVIGVAGLERGLPGRRGRQVASCGRPRSRSATQASKRDTGPADKAIVAVSAFCGGTFLGFPPLPAWRRRRLRAGLPCAGGADGGS